MLSGMSNPEKVLSFLDLFGNWDPSLTFVMIGAIVVAFIFYKIGDGTKEFWKETI